MLCDNQGRAETLLQNREGGQSPVLKTIVVMDSFDPELVKRGAQCGVDVVSMQDVEVLRAALSDTERLSLREEAQTLLTLCLFSRLWGKIIFKSQL